MSLFITQCPHCNTAFRTSISQLQSADGMVRCGACLRVFAADDNLLPSADLRTISAPIPDPSDDEVEAPYEDDALEDFEALDAQIPLTEFAVEEPTPEQPEDEVDSIFTLDMADSLPNRLSPSIDTTAPFWQLIDEPAPEIVEPEIDSEVDAQEAPNALEPLPEEIEETEIAEESEDIELASTLEQDAASTEIPSASETTGGTQEAPLPPFIAVRETAESDAHIRARMSALDIDDDTLGDQSHEAALRKFSAEEIEGLNETESPLELHWLETPPVQRFRTALYVSAIVLTLGMALQYAWFNRESLGQDARFRPLLDSLCSTLPCHLSPLVDIRSIHSDTLIVRSHPEIANALTVNFLFRNDAQFAQPFPGLALRFTDDNGSIVAQRLFAPDEYLPPGVANMQQMPPGSPVQVALDILDPGQNAINYELSFYAQSP